MPATTQGQFTTPQWRGLPRANDDDDDDDGCMGMYVHGTHRWKAVLHPPTTYPPIYWPTYLASQHSKPIPLNCNFHPHFRSCKFSLHSAHITIHPKPTRTTRSMPLQIIMDPTYCVCWRSIGEEAGLQVGNILVVCLIFENRKWRNGNPEAAQVIWRFWHVDDWGDGATRRISFSGFRCVSALWVWHV